MEDQIAELTAKIATLEKSGGMLGTVSVEIFYWWCTALMVCIHAGFLAYEMGASRAKNVLASGIKNILAFAFIVPTFFFFGWWIYLAFPRASHRSKQAMPACPGRPRWGRTSKTTLRRLLGRLRAVRRTTASIFSGAVIERIACRLHRPRDLLGSVAWILAASWGWHPDGWLLTKWGYHDVGCAGVRARRRRLLRARRADQSRPAHRPVQPDGTANALLPHNMPMSLIGLMLIIVGFFGFLGACMIFSPGEQWTNIYAQPATLSSYAFNT
jgi:ammonium transporter, Amt family